MKDLSNTGKIFRLCQPHEEKEKKKKSEALSATAKNFIRFGAWVLKFFVSLSHAASLSNESKAHSGEEMLQRLYVLH